MCSASVVNALTLCVPLQVSARVLVFVFVFVFKFVFMLEPFVCFLCQQNVEWWVGNFQ